MFVEADPLADIRHTQKIQAVVLNGWLLDRKALDEIQGGWKPRRRPSRACHRRLLGGADTSLAQGWLGSSYWEGFELKAPSRRGTVA